MLSRGIFCVLIANIINLGFNLISNFVLPKYLSIETYAYIKTFSLYLTYAGFFHFGYADGMYLKYGGKDKKAILVKDLDDNLSTMRIFQVFIMLCILLVGILMKDKVIILFACTLLPYNMSWYFRNFYQAIGEFKTYGRMLNKISIFLSALNMFLVFIVKTENYLYYLLVYVIVYSSIWIIMELQISKILKQKMHFLKFQFDEFVENIKMGFLLMLGNFSSGLLTSIDRWFVKIWLTSFDFAQYSFAVSMESILNVAVTPITVTMYNFFCRKNEINQIHKIKRYVMMLATLLVAVAFGGDWLIDMWLINYIDSVNVIYFLFGSQIFYIIIKGIYINLYKAQKRQKEYFIKLAVVIIVSFFLNIIAFRVINKIEAFAIATLVSAIFWFMLCLADFPEIRLSIGEIIYITICTCTFLLLGIRIGSMAGFCMYLICVLVCNIIFMNEEIKDVIGFVRNGYRKIIIK